MNPPTTIADLARVPRPPRATTSIHALAKATRERDRRLFFAAFAFAIAMLLLVPFAVLAADPLPARLAEIEGRLVAFPRATATELAQIAADEAPPGEALDRQVRTMYGQALVLSNRTTEALELADRMQAAGAGGNDPAWRASALLIRSEYESWAGNSAKAHELAAHAREVAAPSDDEYVRFATAYAAGVTARMMGRVEVSLASLEEARALAELAQSPYRQASAFYQLSVLDMMLRQADRAYDNALAAHRHAKAAGSAFGMVRAKMAESAALEALNRPRQELAALQEALATARGAGSRVAEALAVVNLADVYLRRKDYRRAHELAREALDLGRSLDDLAMMSVAKLNMGLALLGMGRIDAGRRLADEAVAEYERTGATAEIAETLREYGNYLEQAGDFKSALVLFHRQQKLTEELALADREKKVLELQGRYESDKRKREIELLNRERDLQSAELRNRELEQRVWWSLAAVFGLSFFVIAVLYQKLRATNRLLAQKNAALFLQSSRDPLTALYNRRHFQEFIRDLPAPTERRRGPGEGGGAGAAADRHRPLQADQRPPRSRGGGRGADGGGAAAARHAPRDRHDRALGRRGVPGVRAGRPAGSHGRDRAAHHERDQRRADRVHGAGHPGDGVDRLPADAPAARQLPAQLGRCDPSGGQGALHGQEPWPQPCLRHRGAERAGQRPRARRRRATSRPPGATASSNCASCSACRSRTSRDRPPGRSRR